MSVERQSVKGVDTLGEKDEQRTVATSLLNRTPQGTTYTRLPYTIAPR
jgi:hypothetical protein